jgi:hypothetical protein
MSTAHPSRKLPPRATGRAKAFKVAIVNAETTVLAFAEAADVTPGHLYKVLSGERQSPPLLEKIDAFIAQHTPAASSAA